MFGLGSGTVATVTITVHANAGGTVTNTVTASSAITDPLKANNKAAVKTIIQTLVLGAVRSGNTLVFSWPSGFVLQSTPSLSPPTWTDVTNPATQFVGGQNTVTIGTANGTQYYRIRSGRPAAMSRGCVFQTGADAENYGYV